MSHALPLPAAPAELETLLPPPRPIVPHVEPRPPSTMPVDVAPATAQLLDGVDRRPSIEPSAVQAGTALADGPVARRDGQLVELTSYRQEGKIHVEGDTVTQQIGRGKTAEYSLSQLAAHAKDPEYFAATVRFAARHGDSVIIDVHGGVSRARDPALEHALPQNMPLRDPILRASVMHDIDPKLLAAVGMQETDLGRSPYDNQVTHRGDVEPDSPGGHGYGPFQYDDQKRNGNPGRPQAELDRVAADPYYAADKAAEMLADRLAKTHGNEREALHLYNAKDLATNTTPTSWGPLGSFSYEDSALKFLHEIQTQTSRENDGRGR